MTPSTWTGTNQDTQYLSKELGLGSVVKKDKEEGGGGGGKVVPLHDVRW